MNLSPCLSQEIGWVLEQPQRDNQYAFKTNAIKSIEILGDEPTTLF